MKNLQSFDEFINESSEQWFIAFEKSGIKFKLVKVAKNKAEAQREMNKYTKGGLEIPDGYDAIGMYNQATWEQNKKNWKVEESQSPDINEGNIQIIPMGNSVSKVDREIIEIAKQALPKSIWDRVTEIETKGSWTESFNTPTTISKKGSAYGSLAYNTIILNFDTPIGQEKIYAMRIGIRKRTSGPGTGYLAIDLKTRGKDLISGGVASEFYNDEVDTLRDLYNDEVAKFI